MQNKKILSGQVINRYNFLVKVVMIMKDENENKPFIVYDYWRDENSDQVYAVVEIAGKPVTKKHSNLYFMSSKYYNK